MAERPWRPLCVAKDGTYVLKSNLRTGTPPDRILMPWVDQGDPRLFVRNGELIKPYGIVEFAFIRMEECSELDHDRACYKELIRNDFDPTGCVPINYFNLEKLVEELNDASAIVAKQIADLGPPEFIKVKLVGPEQDAA